MGAERFSTCLVRRRPPPASEAAIAERDASPISSGCPMAFDAISWRKSCRMTEPDLVQALLSAIASGDDAATEAAAQALAGKRSLLPALRPLLTDADPDRRWWAVRTLALIGGDDAARLIIERLADDDEPTRCAAALGLGELRYSQATSALVARLADDSGWVRDSAADALAMLGEPAITALVEALADHRDGVRVRAASALRRILLASCSRGQHAPRDRSRPSSGHQRALSGAQRSQSPCAPPRPANAGSTGTTRDRVGRSVTCGWTLTSSEEEQLVWICPCSAWPAKPHW